MSLSSILPAPKQVDGDEPRLQQRGTRVVGPEFSETGLVVKRSRAQVPSYRERSRNPSWWVGESLNADFFGDGGAFPEINRAQYPLNMGSKESMKRSNALAVTLDESGKVQYDALARQGHNESRIIQASFKDLIPLRQQANAGVLDLSRPSQETVEATAERTKIALAALIGAATSAQKPKSINVNRQDATFVRYTPANQMGEQAAGKERIIKIQQRQLDPMEPARWKHKKIPGRPPSPPAPILRSPPRKLTAADQEMWKIPPAVSNWKNSKGYTVPLDKRVAANGQSLQDVTISDRHAQLAEAMRVAEQAAREEVKQRVEMQQKLAEMERAKKEAELLESARMVKAAWRARGVSESDSEQSGSEDDDRREREQARRGRMREEERKLRQSRMGTERRLQVLAREQNRDMSEKIALGLAKPSQSKEGVYDSRLFNRTSGFDTGFNEDNHYDKPLFEAQNAIASIYRPRTNMDDDDDDEAAGDKEMARIQKTNRFGEALGKGAFKGSGDAEAREGPVQFQKDTADPFNVDQFLAEVEKGGPAPPKRGYGLQESESRQSKRARVEDDD